MAIMTETATAPLPVVILVSGRGSNLQAIIKAVARGTLPVDIRESYQRVVKAKGEDALAPMRGEFCSGCNRRVLLNMMADLRLSKPIFCKSCGRLLYLAEGDEQQIGSVD